MSQTFKMFNLQPFLVEAVSDLGFTVPTPVQEKNDSGYQGW